jgi:hypothetical protein
MDTVHRPGGRIAQRGIGKTGRSEYVLLLKVGNLPQQSPDGIHNCREFPLDHQHTCRSQSFRRCRGNFQRIPACLHRRPDTDVDSSVDIRRSAWRRFSWLLISLGFGAFSVPPGPSIAKPRNRVCNSCVLYGPLTIFAPSWTCFLTVRIRQVRSQSIAPFFFPSREVLHPRQTVGRWFTPSRQVLDHHSPG